MHNVVEPISIFNKNISKIKKQKKFSYSTKDENLFKIKFKIVKKS